MSVEVARDAESHPHPLNSPSNHGGLLNVVGWVFILIAFLTLVTRAGKRWAISKSFGFGDVMIAIAMTIAVLQTACLSLAVGHGYGSLTPANNTEYHNQQKLIYAFNILFLLSQFFSMGSVVILIRNLTPVRWHNTICNWLLYSMGLWVVISTLGLTFQCRPPRTWLSDGNTCIQRVAFFTFVEAFNIVFETFIIVVPIVITWNLHLKPQRKLMVMIGFSGRSLVIAALVAQLVTLYHNTDMVFPFSAWGFALSSSLAQSLSIIAACVPYLRPFIEGIDSGVIDGKDLRRRGVPYDSSISTDKTNINSTLDNESMLRAPSVIERGLELRPQDETYGNEAFIVSNPVSHNGHELRSMNGSKRHIIRQTKTVTVQSTDRDTFQGPTTI